MPIAFNYYSRLAHVLNVERFCISTVYYIIRLSFSASEKNFVCRYCGCPACVCVPVRSFCHHMHLDLDVRVHRGTENSFIKLL